MVVFGLFGACPVSSPARGEQSASPASESTLSLTARLDALLAPVLRPYGIEVAVQVRQTHIFLRLTSDTRLDATTVRRWLVQGFTQLADPRIAQVTVSHYRRTLLEPDWVETLSLQAQIQESTASPAGGRPAVHYLLRPPASSLQRRTLWPLAPAVAGLAGVLVVSPPLVWSSLVASRSQPSAAVSPEPAAVPVADAGRPPGPWPEQVRRSINRTWLTEQFQSLGYTLPPDSGVYAARILPGIDSPAYEFYEAGKGAFSTNFWPASTVKVLAAVAAVEFAAEQGFSGDAQVTFANGFRDRLRHIYDRSIRISSNEDYDWTVRLVGLDWLNQRFLSSERGFPTTVLQRSYTGHGVQFSPQITLQEGERQVSLPPRASSPTYACPNQGNCANLFEMTEVVRRVILHEEVPPQERLRLPPQDVVGLTEALCHSDPSLFRPGVAKVLGDQAEICHKPGWVPGDDCLDAGVVRDPASGERYLLAAVVPYTSGRACDQLATIAEHTLLALRQEPPGAPLQPDAGPPIQVQVAQPGVEGRRQHGFTVTVEGADRVEVYLDDHRLATLSGPGPAYQFQVGLSRSGVRLMRVQAWAGPQVLAFRSLKVQIDPLSSWCQPEHATPLKPEIIRRGPAGRAQVALT
ncbi:MAG: hypothetical protein IGQ88_01625, partial [Gloeomargaritaceae cyanobacterium C42_A2020_066]|nr:hypothetical protein [Gloeomargaritaceae cyanobacterium C42_A2020_066]